MFKGKFYGQIDGITMESPLGPVLANLFMGYHEQSCEGCEQILYHRYMNDTICLFNSESDADKFFVISKSTAPQNKIHS